MGTPVTGNGSVQSGLGGPAGLGEIQLERSDDGALRLDVSSVFEAGLNYLGGSFAATDLWVNTNGTLSFGATFGAYPTAANADLRSNLIAVFWADLDTRLRGEGVESGLVHVDIDPVADVVSITWDNVGFYRRNTDSPARFQLQLYDRGNGDFDIVFRYDSIGMTEGTAADDAGARVLISSSRLVQNCTLPGFGPGSALDTLDTAPGNTGVAGLWVLAVRAGNMAGAQVVPGQILTGTEGADSLVGGALDDLLIGKAGNDRLTGNAGNDTLEGDDGADTLDGGAGDDFIFGGRSTDDLRDIIYAGDGNDSVDGGYGNDDLNGGNGNDTLVGNYGADTLIGNAGADVLSGGPGADMMYGNDGADFLNGGFGNDRMNGGTGADRFYHLGVPDHGSDWVQDYISADGDVLVLGIAGAVRSNLQVNYAHSANDQGVRAGNASVAEAFVIWRPTGQILWALVDGEGQGAILVDLGGSVVDLLS
jgi:hypothetical protein